MDREAVGQVNNYWYDLVDRIIGTVVLSYRRCSRTTAKTVGMIYSDCNFPEKGVLRLSGMQDCVINWRMKSVWRLISWKRKWNVLDAFRRFLMPKIYDVLYIPESFYTFIRDIPNIIILQFSSRMVPFSTTISVANNILFLFVTFILMCSCFIASMPTC